MIRLFCEAREETGRKQRNCPSLYPPLPGPHEHGQRSGSAFHPTMTGWLGFVQCSLFDENRRSSRSPFKRFAGGGAPLAVSKKKAETLRPEKRRNQGDREKGGTSRRPPEGSGKKPPLVGGGFFYFVHSFTLSG